MAKGGGFLKKFTGVCLPIAKIALMGIAALNFASGANLIISVLWKGAVNPMLNGAVNLLAAGVLNEVEEGMGK